MQNNERGTETLTFLLDIHGLLLDIKKGFRRSVQVLGKYTPSA
jgi:hypothetical protein